MVAYQLEPRLEDVLREVAAGTPVIVLENYGFRIWPVWHYSVVVGYDLDAGEITASVNGGPNTTGGNIRIDPEVVILQNDSHIVAKAVGGSGGQITIIADNYFAFPHSEVSAEAGNPDLSGTVEVSAPDVNLAGQLTTLPSSYLDAASLMREACAARRSGERAGSFAVRGNDGIPAEPDGWLPATVALEPAFGPTAGSAKPTAASGPVLASGSCR